MNLIDFGAQATIFRPRDPSLEYLPHGIYLIVLVVVPSGRGNPRPTPHHHAPHEAFTKRRDTERPTTSMRVRLEVVLPTASRQRAETMPNLRTQAGEYSP